MNERIEKMDLQTWYLGYPLPKDFEDQRRIGRFVQDCYGIFTSVVASELKIGRVKVEVTSDPEIEIAVADLEGRKILFSRSLYSPDESKRFNKTATIAQTLSAIMGILIHESGHFAYTNVDYRNLFEHLETNANDIKFSIMNVVDDLFIDTATYKKLPRMRWATDERLNYLFSQKELQRRIDVLNPKGWNDSIEDAIGYFDACIPLKNFHLEIPKSAPEPFLKLTNTVIHARKLDDIFERGRWAVKIYDLLFAKWESEVKEAELNSLVELLDDGDFDVVVEGVEKSKKEQQSTDEDLLVVTTDIDTKFIEGKAGEKDVTIVELAADNDILHRTIKKVPVVDTYKNIAIDERYLKLAQLGRARAERHTFNGPQKKRGTNMSNLYRIATDGKIYNLPEKTEALGPREIIILIDCSASMDGDHIESAFSAAKGAVKSLELARHSVAVYGHTGEQELTDNSCPDLICYRFKGFNERFNVLDKRIDSFLGGEFTYSALLYENNDDLAITYVGDKFTSTHNQKTMIVISDGAPSSRRLSPYDYNTKIELARKAVMEVKRKKGCNIVSISIKENAVKSNNRIYGVGNNIVNDDPNIITALIEKMIK